MGSGTSKTKRPRVRIRKPFSDQDWRDWAEELQAGHMRATDLQNHRGQWLTLRANTDAGVLEYFQGGEWRGLGYGAAATAASASSADGGGEGGGGGGVAGHSHNEHWGIQGGLPTQRYHFQKAIHDELGRFWDGGVWDASDASMAKAYLTTLYGGKDAGESLTLASSEHATKGKVYLGTAHTSTYDEVNDRLGIGTGTPSFSVHIQKSATGPSEPPDIDDNRVFVFAKNTSTANTNYAAIVAENEIAGHGVALAMFGTLYNSVPAFADHGAIYSAELAAGLVVGSLKGPVEFWLYQGAYPAGSYTHVADVTSDGAYNGIFPNEDSKYVLGGEAGPLRWADGSFDQLHIASYALTMSGAAALNQDLRTTDGPTFDHLHITNDAACGTLHVSGYAVTVEAASALNQDLTTDSATAQLAALTLGNTGLHLLDTNASHDLILKPGSDLTADRTLTLTTGDAARIVTLSGDLTVEAASLVNQDLTTDAGPAFDHIHLTTLDMGVATSLEIPNAASPTVDAEGEIAWDTDDDRLLIHDGTAAVCVAAKVKQLSFIIKAPAATDDFLLIQFKRAVTIVAVYALAQGGTNVVGALDEMAGDGTTLQAAVDGDWTIGTTEFSDTSFSNAALDAGDWLRWHTTSVSGTVNFLTVTIEYYES